MPTYIYPSEVNFEILEQDFDIKGVQVITTPIT